METQESPPGAPPRVGVVEGVFTNIPGVAPQATAKRPLLPESILEGSPLDCVSQPPSAGVWKGASHRSAGRGCLRHCKTACRQAVPEGPLTAVWTPPFHTPSEWGCVTQSNAEPPKADSRSVGGITVA